MAPERCPYADKGQVRCPPSICDCFWDLYPDDPFGLHPEAFLVGGHARYMSGEHTADCPGCATQQPPT